MNEDLRTSLELAAKICPELTYMWSNYTTTNVIKMNMTSELPVVLCEAGKLVLMGNNANDIFAKAAFCIAPLGIICCTLALIVLSSGNCAEVTFIYHRVINISDILWLLFSFEFSIYTVVSQSGLYIYEWEKFHTIFGNRLDNAFSDFVELLVAWISVERASVYLPTVFGIINRKRTALIVVVVLFVSATALVIPYALQLTVFFDVSRQVYRRGFSAFGLSPTFNVYLLVYNSVLICRMVLVLCGTVATVFVLMLVSRKKRRLVSIVGLQSSASTGLLQQAKRNQMLCILQLSESLPILAKGVLILMAQSLTFGFTFDTFTGLSYAETVVLMSSFRYNFILMTVRKVVEITSHGLHFVLYCLLSKRMRVTALNTLRHMRFTKVVSIYDK